MRLAARALAGDIQSTIASCHNAAICLPTCHSSSEQPTPQVVGFQVDLLFHPEVILASALSMPEFGRMNCIASAIRNLLLRLKSTYLSLAA